MLAAAAGPAAATEAPPLASLERACELIAHRLASVDLDDCLTARLNAGPMASVQGQPLLWRDFHPAPPRPGAPRVLLIGGIHGDEFSSVSIVFRWIERLAADADQPFHWRVLPLLNPDGLLRVPETRTNARGVDLNRNFPTPEWARTALPYWIDRTGRDPRRYPGPGPESEPETRWLLRHIARFRPQLIIAVHAPYGVLDYDGPHQPPQRLGFLNLHLLGTFPGSLGNYAGTYLGVPVVTLELPRAGVMPTRAEIGRLWNDLVGYLEENFAGVAPLREELLLREPWRAALAPLLPAEAPPEGPVSDWLP